MAATTDVDLEEAPADQQQEQLPPPQPAPIVHSGIGANPMVPSAPADAPQYQRPLPRQPQTPGPLTPPARVAPEAPLVKTGNRVQDAWAAQNRGQDNYQQRVVRYTTGEMFDKQQAALKAQATQDAAARADQAATYNAQQQEKDVINREQRNTLNRQGVQTEEDPGTGIVQPARDEKGAIQYRANMGPEDKQLAVDTDLHGAAQNALSQNVYQAARNVQNTVQLTNRYQNFDKLNPAINETEGGFFGMGKTPTPVAQGLQKQKADLEKQIRGLQEPGTDANAPVNLQELVKNARQTHADAKAAHEAWSTVAPKRGGDIDQLIEDRTNDVLAAGNDPAKDPALTAIKSRQKELGIQTDPEADREKQALRADPEYGPAISTARDQVANAQAQITPVQTRANQLLSKLENVTGFDTGLTSSQLAEHPDAMHIPRPAGADPGDPDARLAALRSFIDKSGVDRDKKGQVRALLTALEPTLAQLRQSKEAMQPVVSAHDALQSEWQKKYSAQNGEDTSKGPGDFETKLSPPAEAQFQKWKAKVAPNDSGRDYDLRGAFTAGFRPNQDGHWPDTFKKPNHPTFSDQSIYAKDAPDLAGHWDGDTFVQAPAAAAAQPATAAPAPPGAPASGISGPTAATAPAGGLPNLVALRSGKIESAPSAAAAEEPPSSASSNNVSGLAPLPPLSAKEKHEAEQTILRKQVLGLPFKTLQEQEAQRQSDWTDVQQRQQTRKAAFDQGENASSAPLQFVRGVRNGYTDALNGLANGISRMSGDKETADFFAKKQPEEFEHKPGISEKMGEGIGGAAPMMAAGLPGAVIQAGIHGYEGEMEKSGDTTKAVISALKSAPEMAAYWLLGGAASKVVAPLLKAASPLVKAGAGAVASTIANTLTSASIRAANGEPISPTTQGFTQDALFGLMHGVHTGVTESKSEAGVRKLLEQAPTETLKLAASDPDFRKSSPYNPKLIDEELAKRPAGVTDLEATGNPEVAGALSEARASGETPASQRPTPAAAHAEINSLQPSDRVAPEQVAPTQVALRAMVKISQGEPMEALTADERRAVLLKHEDGLPRVEMVKGTPVILDSALERVRAIAPETAAFLPKDEASQRQQILKANENPPEGQIQAVSQRPASPESAVALAEDKTSNTIEAPQGRGGRESTPLTPDVQKRSGLLSKVLQRNGVDEETATAFAQDFVKKHGAADSAYDQRDAIKSQFDEAGGKFTETGGREAGAAEPRGATADDRTPEVGTAGGEGEAAATGDRTQTSEQATAGSELNGPGGHVEQSKASAERKVAGDLISSSANNLPDKMRHVMARLAAGDEPGAIARDLGISKQGVSNLKLAALRRLRGTLGEKGITGIDDEGILQMAMPAPPELPALGGEESEISEGDKVRDTSTRKKGLVTQIKGNRATVSLDDGGITPVKIDSLVKSGESSPTGIKNAIVDKQRQDRGLPERMAPLRKSNPQAWDSAMEKIDRNSFAGRELVARLKENPEPLKPEDSALLAHETVTRENAFDNAIEDVNNAKTPDALAEAKQRLDLARNDVQELYDAGQRAGTESGQSLQARKMMVNQDYSLAKMEATKRAIANDGKPLSEAQLSEVKAAHDKIAELQAKIDRHESRAAETQMSDYFNELLKSTKAEAKQGVSDGKSLTNFMDDQAAKARERIIARRGRLQVTVDPLNVAGLVDEAIIGASHIAKGVTKFADWSKEMVKDFGERISPYLEQLFDRAQKYHDAHAKLFATEAEKGTPKSALGKIGDSIDKLTQKQVYDLARAHVNNGSVDLDGVMKAVTSDLQKKFPDITERDVRDKFSGYGEVRLPSKAKDLAALRDLRRQAQLVSALEDAQQGETPRKSGMQRDTPSDTVRELQRKVVEAMRESGIQTVDPERQLASNLQRYKTSLRNRTADLQRKIVAGDYTKRTPAQTQLDNEAMKLKSDYETERQKFETQIERDRLAKRPVWEKALEQIAGTARMSALSGYHTLAKLAGYDIAKFVETPVTELIGAGISKLPGMRGISAKANLESGSTLNAVRDFYVRAATKGMVEAWRVIRTGKTEAKTLYGKPEYQPPKWYDFFGNVHMAEKAPLITGTQAMYLRRATENALRAGIDPSNEFARAAINKAVYDHSQKAILQENNKFAEAVNGLHARLEAANPKSGQVDIANAIVSTLVKTFLTKGIVKTPANYFSQTIARTPIGLATGIAKAGMAHYRGIGNLHPVEANAIHALIKTGAVGSAFFILGMIDATKKEEDRAFGGYWEPGRKRGTGDVDWGKIRIAGTELPHIFTHNPLTESAQMGSTMMRVAMSKFRKKDEETQGMTKGAITAILGLAGKAPIASPVMRMGQGRSDVGADLISGLVPQLLQNIAEDTDQKERAPKTTTEKIKSTIPGLRQTVPEKTESKSHGTIIPGKRTAAVPARSLTALPKSRQTNIVRDWMSRAA